MELDVYVEQVLRRERMAEAARWAAVEDLLRRRRPPRRRGVVRAVIARLRASAFTRVAAATPR
jgi:hypothetical protein